MSLRSFVAAAMLATVTASATAAPKVVAIATFGEHPALQEVIDSMKQSLIARGYAEGQQIAFTFNHVNWERNLIPQMLAKVAADRPAAIVTITTPVTQTAVRALGDSGIPVIFAAVQDPVVAGVVPSWTSPSKIMTGASNLVDMEGTLKFIKTLIPNAKRVGLPYNPGDDADNALRARLIAAAPGFGLELVQVGIDNVNDMPQRMQAFAGKVDALYVIPSNLFQPVTAQIAALTARMKIPTFNGLPAPVAKGEMLASYSVDWKKIGVSAADIVEKVVFKDTKVSDIPPSVPTPADHQVVISKSQLEKLGLEIPASLANCNCLVN